MIAPTRFPTIPGFVLLLALAGCDAAPDASNGAAPAASDAPLPVTPVAVPALRTAGVEQGAPADVAVWQDRERPGDLRILAAAGTEGLAVYLPDGSLAGIVESLAAALVVVVPDVDGNPLLVAYDSSAAQINAFRFDAQRLASSSVMPEPLAVDDELTGLCHYRSPLAGRDYLYAVTDAGLVLHYELHASDGAIGGRLLRTLPSGKGSGFCAVDPRDGMLYVSEESTGVWRFGAEPESDTTREPIDVRRPFGSLSDDLKGIAVYPVDAELSYLLVADVGARVVAVYRLPGAERVASLAIEGLVEPEGATAVAGALGSGFPAGLLVVADENMEAGLPDVKLVDWQALGDAAGLRAATTAPELPAGPAVVRPVLESDVVSSFGDAADDPAIWVNKQDPADSLVIGTNKKAGLRVYDLDGRTLQVLEDGRMNNVDVRDGFPLAGENVPIVIASNRSSDSIAVYRIDAAGRRLVDVAAGVIDTGFSDPYGACLYRSAGSGEFFVFVNEGGVGDFRQWRLYDDGSGRVAAERVREFSVGSQAEGCVADDATAALYIAEEDHGLWRYSAEPDGGDTRQAIDDVVDGRLTDDIEGVALVASADGSGYLVASNQGADNYAVYRREGSNEFVGFFHVVADAERGVDGASETDGLDVTGAALGPPFARGLLVVQDGRNIAPEAPQNFKYVAWADVLAALGEQ